MKEVKFKININCGNCVCVVIGFLVDVKGISYWEVNIDDFNKILVVQGEIVDI